LRHGGVRLSHGALIPHFIWVSDDGEIRVAGQQLGKGLIASLKDSKIAGSIGRYFSPDYQNSGEATQASEVYSLGAILFLLISGNEPPDPLHVSAFAQAIRAAKTTAGDPMPDDIRAILDKSLVIDASRRFGSVGDMKQALSNLAHSGKYSATTFNLAFYLTSLLKKEVEGEAIEREKESKVNIIPYLEHQVELAAPPIPLVAAKARRNKMALYVSTALLAIAVGGAGFWMIGPPMQAEKAQIRAAAPKRLAPATPAVITAQPVAPAATATTEPVDPAAQKKAFEAAVNEKMQQEMAKLQSEFNKQLPQKKPARVQSPPPVLTASMASQKEAAVLDDRAPSAAALDERRLAARQEPAAQPIQSPAPLTQSSPLQTQTQLQPQPAPQVQLAAPTVKEGDMVNYDDLEVRPQVISRPNLMYPPMAMRQKVQTSLILTVLVSENGDVTDVRILRGDARFGFNDEAMRLLRGTKFRPAMKDGKRVKTWIPQPVEFKLQ
ncbi:MAG: hypothetical protein DMF58_06365, partial [Acidobacteria bacterium]